LLRFARKDRTTKQSEFYHHGEERSDEVIPRGY
jgi:hypothetical protein